MRGIVVVSCCFFSFCSSSSGQEAKQRIDNFFSQQPAENAQRELSVAPDPVVLAGKAVMISPERLGIKIAVAGPSIGPGGINLGGGGISVEGRPRKSVVEVSKNDVLDIIKSEGEDPDLVFVKPEAILAVRSEYPAAILASGTGPVPRAEGIFDRIVDRVVDALPIDRVTQLDARIRFKNSTNATITVVMDNNRERHVIAPSGEATFVNANVGDRPTFQVLNQSGASLATATKGPIGFQSRLDYQGGTSF